MPMMVTVLVTRSSFWGVRIFAEYCAGVDVGVGVGVVVVVGVPRPPASDGGSAKSRFCSSTPMKTPATARTPITARVRRVLVGDREVVDAAAGSHCPGPATVCRPAGDGL